MKQLFLLIVGALVTFSANAQINDPVRWEFKSEKIAENTFEVHFTARIQAPWHIYAQDVNGEVGLPTTISFNKNPLVEVDGKPQELGKPEEKKIEGVLLKYYPGKVEFVQVVKLKAPIKANISGKVDYMACTDSHCLPPAQRGFSIFLDNKQ